MNKMQRKNIIFWTIILLTIYAIGNGIGILIYLFIIADASIFSIPQYGQNVMYGMLIIYFFVVIFCVQKATKQLDLSKSEGFIHGIYIALATVTCIMILSLPTNTDAFKIAGIFICLFLTGGALGGFLGGKK